MVPVYDLIRKTQYSTWNVFTTQVNISGIYQQIHTALGSLFCGWLEGLFFVLVFAVNLYNDIFTVCPLEYDVCSCKSFRHRHLPLQRGSS